MKDIAAATTPERKAVQTVRAMAAVVGATFVLVGILGFVPGVTTNLDAITWAGHESDAELFGLFEVSVLHNILHLGFGVAGLVLARSVIGSLRYLLWGGVAYLGLWAYGVMVDHDHGANIVPVNDADNWLHLGLSIGMIFLAAVGRGLLTPRAAERAPGRATN
ncbi:MULTISPECIES: DUF4383 domain-containing protein [unclassified Mumia]|uniref:DUF4383 domain-containing protein n=1 Tax=unclassified Mumia TaxID=2621872 RepID=UPI0021041E27|nr:MULTISPECIES: DUF4383 domain-containing protein [unclassified Mumia]MDD9347450.1 DUF4383 domain-containing protein [Mumia sp.]